jgi:hypothetical protein
LIQSFSVPLAIALALLTSVESEASAQPNSCVRVIKAWHEAINCQITEQIERLTWPDGFTGTGRLGKWSDVKLNGPCPKYVSELRDWRISPVSNDRQTVRVRERYWYVDANERATGLPMTARLKYTCERRGGQWRIFSKE